MKTSAVIQWRKQKETASLIGKVGTLTQWTIIRVTTESFAKEAPYPVVLVKLEGSCNIGQLVDWTEKDLVVGRKVIAVLRRNVPESSHSLIEYSIKYKPYED